MSCKYCEHPIDEVENEDGTITEELAGRDPDPFYDNDNICLYIGRDKLLNIENTVDYHESHNKLRINFCPACGESLKNLSKRESERWANDDE